MQHSTQYNCGMVSNSNKQIGVTLVWWLVSDGWWLVAGTGGGGGWWLMAGGCCVVPTGTVLLI